MSAPTRGIPIELDRKRHLRFPLGVLKDIADTDADVLTMIWLGLKHEDPELTIEQVGEIVDLEMLPTLTDALKKASGGMLDLTGMVGSVVEGEAQPEGKAKARRARRARSS